jgi:hypothetical protein
VPKIGYDFPHNYSEFCILAAASFASPAKA